MNTRTLAAAVVATISSCWADTGTAVDVNQALLWGSLGMAAIVLLLLIRSKTKLQTLLKEKEEKIEWLRRIKAENEYRLEQQIRKLEHDAIEYEHTIEKLQKQLQEGTKNQVVAKIEALRRQRERYRHLWDSE